MLEGSCSPSTNFGPRRADRHPDAPDEHHRGHRRCRKIRGEHPEIGVVVLSQFADEEYAYELLKDGAAGLEYLLKGGWPM